MRLRSRHRRKAVAAHGGVFGIRPGSDVLCEGGIARFEFLPRHVACGSMDHGCFDLPWEKEAGKQLRKQKDRRKRHTEKCHAESSEESGLFRSVHGDHLIHHILLHRARPVNAHMTGSKMAEQRQEHGEENISQKQLPPHRKDDESAHFNADSSPFSSGLQQCVTGMLG